MEKLIFTLLENALTSGDELGNVGVDLGVTSLSLESAMTMSLKKNQAKNYGVPNFLKASSLFLEYCDEMMTILVLR